MIAFIAGFIMGIICGAVLLAALLRKAHDESALVGPVRPSNEAREARDNEIIFQRQMQQGRATDWGTYGRQSNGAYVGKI